MFDDVSLDNTEKDNLEGTAEVTDMEDVPMEAEVAADWEEKDSKYPFDRDALWRRGMSAIDDNMDMIREDYLDKGYEEGKELDGLLAQERAKLFDEFVSDFNQSDADDLENAEQEEVESTEEDSKYPFDRDALWRRGMSAIDDNMDMIREDYLDKGYEEGKEMDELLAQERAKLFDEFVSDFYQSDADDIENAEQEEFDSLSDTASFIEDDAAEWNEVDESTDTTNDTTDEYEQDELENDTE